MFVVCSDFWGGAFTPPSPLDQLGSRLYYSIFSRFSMVEQASALFNNAKKAEEKLDHRNLAPDRLSKGGFFMLCALGKARFSKVGAFIGLFLFPPTDSVLVKRKC